MWIDHIVLCGLDVYIPCDPCVQPKLRALTKDLGLGEKSSGFCSNI